MLLALLKGFVTSGSLIVAIGAQNAFVIRQGLLRNHLFLTASLCSLIDAALIMLGILGFGKIISEYPSLIFLSNLFAIVFLFFYGAFALQALYTKKRLNDFSSPTKPTKRKTILLLLAFSLLNPHVYLDTVILLGSIASQQPLHEQIYFGWGAISASFIWFFTITYGSFLLAPLLSSPFSWKMIDVFTAVTLWGMALCLAWPLIAVIF